MPSPSKARNVIGIVAAVLAVLMVLAMTFRAPGGERRGDIRASNHICKRYHDTWVASPSATTAISQISDWKTFIPSFWPTLEATIPKTANGTSATTQSSTFIKSSKPIVSRSTTTWNEVSPRAFWLSRILTNPTPSAG